jgi:alanine dehydrogenase
VGLDALCEKDPGFAMGINVRNHRLVHPAVMAAYAADGGGK